MGKKSVSGRLLCLILLVVCLLFTISSNTGLYAGQNKTQKSQTKAKKSAPVDLSIQDFTLSKSNIQIGAKVSMQFRIRLKGKLKTSTYADIYLTAQRHKYSRKHRIFRRTIKSSHFNPAGIIHLQKYHKIPLTHPAGSYYFILVVDGGNAVKEWDEKNNTAARTVQIKRESMPQMASRPEVNPDVAVEQAQINPQVVKDGEPLKISFYVSNPGKVHIAEVGYRVSIRIMGGVLGGTKRFILRTGVRRNLAPASRQEVNLNVNIPVNIRLPSQPDFLSILVDHEHKLNEKTTDRANNLAKVLITIKITKWPDLAVSKFNSNLAGSFKDRLPKGQELRTDLTFKNFGDRTSDPCRYQVLIHYWKIRRNLAGNPVSAKWERIDEKLYDIYHLEPNKTQVSSLRFASQSWKEGRYRIKVFVDSSGKIIESNEDNNKFQKIFFIH